MSYKQSHYVSKPVDQAGFAQYTEEENATWQILFERQRKIVEHRACDEFIQGIDILNMPGDRIPQCPEISDALQKATGWALEPVAALIPFEHFFHLLANRRFPAATFIRVREELDYLQEPDIFHEVFGHCPLLTNPAYAEFTHLYGKLGLKANKEDRALLARLYWFTIEFGLIRQKGVPRIYGGGILSSKGETIYSLEDPGVIRKPFDPLEVLRTPYRIDIMQPIYFMIDSFDTLFDLTNTDLIGLVHKARELGEFDPLFDPNGE
ncbi:MAG TPA: phenylalanine 4-monooxygenase [Gammaproteobacteria bacterium]|nr:phenylalanine 4-monooxygenase [Gammaproteobacteria bacterium]